MLIRNWVVKFAWRGLSQCRYVGEYLEYAIANALGISASSCKLLLHSNIVRFPQFQTESEVTLDITILGSQQSIREKTNIERGGSSAQQRGAVTLLPVWRRLAPLDLGYQRDIERRRPSLRKSQIFCLYTTDAYMFSLNAYTRSL